MREIKFRAWVGKMEYDVTTGKFGTFFINKGAKGNGLDERDSATLTPFNTKFPDDTPVMQYTGLKDKNGKEIYEGDIVKVIETSHSENEKQKLLRGSSADYNIDEYTGTVTWDNEGCDYSLIQKNQTIENAVGFPRHSYEHEVIGNIYENPELIEK